MTDTTRIESLEKQNRNLYESHKFMLNLVCMMLLKHGPQRIDTAFYIVPSDATVLTYHKPEDPFTMFVELGAFTHKPNE